MRLPFTAGERHTLPCLVLAWQRGASAIFNSPAFHGCMRLVFIFGGPPIDVDVLMVMDMLFMADGDFLASGATFALDRGHGLKLSGRCLREPCEGSHHPVVVRIVRHPLGQRMSN